VDGNDALLHRVGKTHIGLDEIIVEHARALELGPHGDTPAEVYFRLKGKKLVSDAAPCVAPGCGATELPFSIGFLDKEERLPVLLRNAA